MSALRPERPTQWPAAIHGKKRAFVAEVRAAGPEIGLMMEPEHFGHAAAIRTDHPEWFIPVGAMVRTDVVQPTTCNWMRLEIGRLVETHDLAWMKVDFKLTFRSNASGAELHD